MTNEGQGVKNVRIKANIVSRPDSTYPVVIHPMKIEFAETDSLETLEFTIINKTTESITPSVVSAPNRLVSVSLPPWIAAADSAKGSMKLKKAGRGKSFEKSLTIQLNDDAKSRFTIPIERVGIGQEVVVPTHGH